jgi:hypothetical protein
MGFDVALSSCDEPGLSLPEGLGKLPVSTQALRAAKSAGLRMTGYWIARWRYGASTYSCSA